MAFCDYGLFRRAYLLFILLPAWWVLYGCQPFTVDRTVPLTAAGKPEDGHLEVFKGEPFFDIKEVFNGVMPVRETYHSLYNMSSLYILYFRL